jgi:hypothetical protein
MSNLSQRKQSIEMASFSRKFWLAFNIGNINSHKVTHSFHFLPRLPPSQTSWYSKLHLKRFPFLVEFHSWILKYRFIITKNIYLKKLLKASPTIKMFDYL